MRIDSFIKHYSELGFSPLDLRVLIKKVYSIKEEEQLSHGEREIDESAILPLLERRKNGESVAYITGEKEFYSLPFYVNKNVLVPRPDTEILVEKALSLSYLFSEPKILDLCAGSGAVGIALSHTLKRDVFLSDISKDALTVAEKNYFTLLGKKGEIREGDLFSCWENEKFDIIVSNPPYLTDKDLANAGAEVRNEPELALLGGGHDGLDMIRRIIKESHKHLNNKGFLCLEADPEQMDKIKKLLRDEGFRNIEIEKDLGGDERVISAASTT